VEDTRAFWTTYIVSPSSQSYHSAVFLEVLSRLFPSNATCVRVVG
jgi:hypothetical protein